MRPSWLLVSWCRRRDSNSHSFRHYPLKIACLPISPRRLELRVRQAHEECALLVRSPIRTTPECTLKQTADCRGTAAETLDLDHFVGIWAAPEAGATGAVVAGV